MDVLIGAFPAQTRYSGMSEHPTDWKAALPHASSFRRIYALSADIAESGLTSSEVRSAARRVVKTLSGVIDLPVADARVLAKARKQFAKLCKLLL